MKKLFTLICVLLTATALSAQPSGRKKAFEDYGTLVTLLSEDFSLMTTGSYGNPDFTLSICYDFGQYEYPWWNMKPEYTHEPHWGGMNTWSAGGSVYLEATQMTGGARLNTPLFDGTARGEKVILRFKARAEAGEMCNCAFIEGGETHDMGRDPEFAGQDWRFFSSQAVGEITDQWKTYEFLFEEAGPTSLLAITVDAQRGTSIAPIYIDDVEILQIEQDIASPNPLPHTWYKGHGQTASFQANWAPIADAEHYILDIFTVNSLGEPADYLVQDMTVNDTKYTVDDAVSGQTYYYTIRAVKGEYESLPSKKMEVVGLGEPENLTATEIVDGQFTASWDAVPTAVWYNYLAYYDRKATSAGAFTVTDEPNDNLRFPAGTNDGGETPQETDFAGQRSTLTVDQYLVEKQKIENGQSGVNKVYFQTFDRYELSDYTQVGWYATHALPFADCLKIDGWFYQYGAGDAGLISPVLDLSKNGGAFTLDASVFGINDEFGNYTSAAVALFNYDEETSNFQQAELIYAEQKAEAWQQNTYNFTKGSDKSMLGLYAVRGAEAIFVKNLNITQNYEAGQSFLDPFFTAARTTETSVTVDLARQVVDADVYHRVQAVRPAESSNPNIAYDEIFSQFAEMQSVGHGTSAIVTPSAAITGATVRLGDGQLLIDNRDAADVEVFTLSGEKIFTDRSGNATIAVPVQGNRGYLVKVGKQTVKVVLK